MNQKLELLIQRQRALEQEQSKIREEAQSLVDEAVIDFVENVAKPLGITLERVMQEFRARAPAKKEDYAVPKVDKKTRYMSPNGGRWDGYNKFPATKMLPENLEMYLQPGYKHTPIALRMIAARKPVTQAQGVANV